MNETIAYTVLSLTGVGLLAAVILYWVSKKFHVAEDQRVARVAAVLPNTNCGGCGLPGCQAFAQAVVKAGELTTLHCPVGGNPVMKQVAAVLGVHAVEREPYVAVVRCAGSFEHRKKTNVYDGAPNCSVASQLYSGDTGCAYGCLGLGDCAVACDFEAMYMDAVTGLPVVVEDKCTACNACVNACPKDILELWPKGKKNQRIYVACLNEDKGSAARKACAVACSGCAKCAEACRYEAISISGNLAAIDPEKCKLCAECIDTCDVRNIVAANFSFEKLEQASAQRQKREERALRKRAEEKEEKTTPHPNQPPA